MPSLLIFASHGTYGRDDDAYGAMMMANVALAKMFEVTVALIDDGTAMAKMGQDPSRVGLPSNLDQLSDLMELGGRLVLLREHLLERGIRENDLIDGAEVLEHKDLWPLIEEHDLSLTF